MTVSFANVQIRVEESSSPLHRKTVADGVGARLAEQEGWERVDNAAAADRSLLVGPAHGEGWVGVYLDRADRFEEVESFGAALSEEVAATAVGFRADGADLQLSLGRVGERVATVRRSGEEQREGLEDAWFELAGGEGEPEALRHALRASSKPPEDRVRELAGVFGMDARLVAAGYRYLQLNVTGETDEMHYRRVDSSDEIVRVGGAPEFEVPDRVRELESSVGEEVRTSTSVGNLGGEVNGIRVEVGGSACDEGLVDVDAIRVSGGVGQKTLESGQPLEMSGAEDERSTVSAEFEDFTLAAALSEDVDLADMSDERGREVMKAHRASRVSVYARGQGIRPGEGELTIEVMAENDQGADAARASSQIEIHPEPRMPREARSEHAPTHTLRQMEQGGTLFALLHFDTPIGAWVSLASDAMSRWAADIASPSDSFAVVELSGPRSRPDEQLEAAETFSDSEQMAERIGELGDVYQWSAVLRPDERSDERLEPEATAGFSYFSCGGPESTSGADPAPALGFWVSVEDRGDEVASLEARLRELVGEFSRSGRLIQALMTRWNWAPALSLRTLPYEIVCGLDSSGHLRVEWLRQYLRAAAPDLWVGPSLWKRIDEDAVRELADVVELGETRRVSLSGEHTLDELEAALAPVLPGADEWSDEKS